MSSTYGFIVDTYRTERLKVLSMWRRFDDEDLQRRPVPTDRRGRSMLEQMVHQCVSENLWFLNLGVDVDAPPLPQNESVKCFVERYAEDSGARLRALENKDDAWWEEEIEFFDVRRSRAWIMVRRIAHTAHHRGQQTMLARLSGYPLYSTYGPTADTGGLFQNEAPTIYPFKTESDILEGEEGGAVKTPLPEPTANDVTERPDV